MSKYSYLALGDSYTIGEQVPQKDCFPYQTVAILNKTAGGAENRQGFEDPLIIAKTGWTTDELNAAIDAANITKKFDIVSLLIGVNNQYRGRSVEEYKTEFEGLLKRAIGFAAGNKDHVFVLSIPDWGVTPFAEGRDRKQVALEIDEYNAAAKKICDLYKIVFIDITTEQRRHGKEESFLAEDKLHPSGKEYAKWAAQLSTAIKKIVVA